MSSPTSCRRTFRCSHRRSAPATLQRRVQVVHRPRARAVQSELGRAITDEQLGMQMDDAIRRVAARMAEPRPRAGRAACRAPADDRRQRSRDPRRFVGTLRERADLRRLVRTLTAQGRMARWILTALPIGDRTGVLGFQPDMFSPMIHSGGGQVAFVIAAVMVGLGSMSSRRSSKSRSDMILLLLLAFTLLGLSAALVLRAARAEPCTRTGDARPGRCVRLWRRRHPERQSRHNGLTSSSLPSGSELSSKGA